MSVDPKKHQVVYYLELKNIYVVALSFLKVLNFYYLDILSNDKNENMDMDMVVFYWTLNKVNTNNKYNYTIS